MDNNMDHNTKIISGEHHKTYVCKDGCKVVMYTINNDPDNYFIVTESDVEEYKRVIPINDMKVLLEGIDKIEVPMSPSKKSFLAVLSDK